MASKNNHYVYRIVHKESLHFYIGLRTCKGTIEDDPYMGSGTVIADAWAGHMDYHGPNIVFNSDIDPQLVINFINKYWDLSRKTDGLSKDNI